MAQEQQPACPFWAACWDQAMATSSSPARPTRLLWMLCSPPSFLSFYYNPDAETRSTCSVFLMRSQWVMKRKLGWASADLIFNKRYRAVSRSLPLKSCGSFFGCPCMFLCSHPSASCPQRTLLPSSSPSWLVSTGLFFPVFLSLQQMNIFMS